MVMRKEKISGSLQERDRDLFQARERMKLNHARLITMRGCEWQEFPSKTGSSAYSTSGYFDYPVNDLRTELDNSSMAQSLPFTPQQLQTMLRSCAEGLGFLQSKKMVHGNIRPKYITVEQEKSVFRISDRLKNPQAPHYVQLMNLKNEPNLYMSPILYKNLLEGNRKFRHNPFKSDAFSLGLCILEAALGKTVQSIFLLESREVDRSELSRLCQELRAMYGSDARELVSMIISLCAYQEEERPNFIEFCQAMQIPISEPLNEIQGGISQNNGGAAAYNNGTQRGKISLIRVILINRDTKPPIHTISARSLLEISREWIGYQYSIWGRRIQKVDSRKSATTRKGDKFFPKTTKEFSEEGSLTNR